METEKATAPAVALLPWSEVENTISAVEDFCAAGNRLIDFFAQLSREYPSAVSEQMVRDLRRSIDVQFAAAFAKELRGTFAKFHPEKVKTFASAMASPESETLTDALSLCQVLILRGKYVSLAEQAKDEDVLVRAVRLVPMIENRLYRAPLSMMHEVMDRLCVAESADLLTDPQIDMVCSIVAAASAKYLPWLHRAEKTKAPPPEKEKTEEPSTLAEREPGEDSSVGKPEAGLPSDTAAPKSAQQICSGPQQPADDAAGGLGGSAGASGLGLHGGSSNVLAGEALEIHGRRELEIELPRIAPPTESGPPATSPSLDARAVHREERAPVAFGVHQQLQFPSKKREKWSRHPDLNRRPADYEQQVESVSGGDAKVAQVRRRIKCDRCGLSLDEASPTFVEGGTHTYLRGKAGISTKCGTWRGVAPLAVSR